jgi:hypothetical protein
MNQITHLISAEDFILQMDAEISEYDTRAARRQYAYEKIVCYTKLITRKPKYKDFIGVNSLFVGFKKLQNRNVVCTHRVESKDRRIDIIFQNNGDILIWHKLNWVSMSKISDLTQYNLPLTSSAIKQIYQ